MQEQVLTEWLVSPETQALVHYLRRRRAPAVDSFLAGAAIPEVLQGRAAAFHEIERLLTKSADEVRKIFERNEK